MVHKDTKLSSHSKKSKHRKEVTPSSSSASEGSSSDDSPPRHQEKHRNTIKSKRREKSPPAVAERSKSSNTHKRHERKRSASSSESPDEAPSPPKHRKKSDRHEGHGDHHIRNVEKHSRKHKIRDEDRHRPDHRETRDRKYERKSAKPRSPNMNIKREEDFDRRQEEIRRRRRRENEQRERDRGMANEVRVKREPNSDEERSHRNRHGHRDDRRKNRNDIERERRENDARRAEAWQKRQQEGGQNAEALLQDSEETKEKEKPNLGLSGALTEDTNTFRGVVIKYSEPPEARVPSKKWRLYPFKGDEALKVLHLHRQSAYLLGKLRRIVDIPIDHPSCSKQHAVFQFRMVEDEKPDGTKKRIVKPYIIDLDSANGTFVNNQKIDPRRYVELKEKDVIKFAYSSREYVLIHDKSDTTEIDASGEESDED